MKRTLVKILSLTVCLQLSAVVAAQNVTVWETTPDGQPCIAPRPQVYSFSDKSTDRRVPITIGDYDLVLITSPNLEHVWEQGECHSTDIREITIQFTSDVLPECLLNKNQFHSIRQMLERARLGLAFSGLTIMKIYGRLDELTHRGHGFHAVLSFLELLYDLSLADDSRTLSSSSFAHVKTSSESRRVNKVQQYIANHFREEVRLEQVAELAGMTPVAFSRFFHQRTGRTLSDYIIEIRLGFASRMLIDTTMTAAEICYDSGFNTLSNFNRLFRKHKGCSPTEFRENFNKKKIII